MHKEVKVVFEPSGRSVFVLPGTVALEAAAQAGFIIETPCGGAAKCGKCLIRVSVGELPATDTERRLLGPARIAEGYRLACVAKISAPVTIEIPETSLFQSQKILTADTREALEIRPRVRKTFVTLTPPEHGDTHSDLELLHNALGAFSISMSALRTLPRVLRAGGFKVTAICVDDKLIAVETGDTTSACYGIAFDIGSTTLVGTLVDLRTGADLGIAARMNPQTSFGDDVVSRISRCRTDTDGLAQLQASVLGGVNKIIRDLLQKSGVDAGHIYEIVFAGNTTMQQILCGVDPSALGELPFLPAFTEAVETNAADLRLAVNPEANIYVFPQIGGFVGGDTVAGIVATRLDRYTEPALLVDIGTNGEIVLAHNGQLLATSVAAGPAFEGARIVNGMRGANGAIEKVLFNSDVEWNVIGNVKPAGICGTGLIDAAAGMLRAGVLDSTGRILAADEAPAGVSAALRARLVPHGHEIDFLLVPAKDSATGQPIFLYQRDIRELQLANGAIRAGINILLKSAGLQPDDLHHVLLAGAFGNFIRRSNAKRIGMLPPISCRRVQFVGNTASFGAKRALLSTAEKDYAEQIVRQVRHLDLSLDPDFQMEFSLAMLLPENVVEDCDDAEDEG